jgi:Concanavalin A-like lectin/glucanases superfamily
LNELLCRAFSQNLLIYLPYFCAILSHRNDTIRANFSCRILTKKRQSKGEFIVSDPTEGQPFSFDFHPATSLELGFGFFPTTLQRAGALAIDLSEPPSTDNRISSANLEIEFVRNLADLRRSLALDVKIDARTLTFRGSANFSFEESNFVREDVINLVVSASVEFGRRRIARPGLLPEAEALRQNPRQFIQRFGSLVPLVERRGAALHSIITLSELSETSRNLLRSGLAVSAGIGLWSADLRSSIKTEMEQQRQRRTFNIQLLTTGVGNTDALAATLQRLPFDATDGLTALFNIRDELANAIRSLGSPDTAAPTGFLVNTMEALFQVRLTTTDLLSESKDECLSAIVDRFREVRVKRAHIGSLVQANREDAESLLFDGVAQLPEAARLYDEHLTRLRTLHERVMPAQEFNCELPDDELPFEREILEVRPASLLAHYEFVRGATDSTSHQNDCAITGNIQFRREGQRPVAVLDGQGFLSINNPQPSLDHLSDSSFTLSVWVNLSEFVGVPQTIFCYGGGSLQAPNYLALLLDGQSFLRFDVRSIRSDRVPIIVNEAFPVNSFQHLVGVRDRASNRVALYRNGERFLSVRDEIDEPIIFEPRILFIGANMRTPGLTRPEEQFRGFIGDFRLYDRALTDQEIGVLHERTRVQ